jgi:hypothetical protein
MAAGAGRRLSDGLLLGRGCQIKSELAYACSLRYSPSKFVKKKCKTTSKISGVAAMRVKATAALRNATKGRFTLLCRTKIEIAVMLAIMITQPIMTKRGPTALNLPD